VTETVWAEGLRTREYGVKVVPAGNRIMGSNQLGDMAQGPYSD
jgi:hypothetical protein